MDILMPSFGLFFWSTVIFLTFFFILRKFAWKPILNALHERESHIEQSLKQAEEARGEMAKLKSDNEALLKEAKEERNKIVADARTLGDRLVKEAKEAAASAAEKEKEKARQEIDAEKRAALAEIKSSAAEIALEVAEKLLRKEFENKDSQKAYAQSIIADLSNN
ncbi:F0F1 ATP synthase subunit B [Pontibacter sp. G13]|uniref:F0F1 ATP synthase subunit B n=1 Tax=Pontibacter sp. G13 TaxID=3074898 RepID=UPI00288C590C|nr:F0F1 ATP synthase subunit B [Pontibacter sp. G13]WNJ21392.1 F0F1 ATP synthase subunit B [Pontibacter sp. G13]